MAVLFKLSTGSYLHIEVDVDWDNDGVFEHGTYEDITADVEGISYERGKDEKLPFDLIKANTGRCEIVVKNIDRKYTPTYSSSVLYPNVKPKRAVRVRFTFNNTLYERFYGYIEDIIPHPKKQERYASIFCVDGMDFLAKEDARCALQENQYTGVLVGKALDSAGWPTAKRRIDTGVDQIALWYSRGKALNEIRKIEDTEVSFFYIDGSGNAVYEDRHHRLKGDHLVSQASFDDTMTDLPFEYRAQSVFNKVKCSVTPHDVAALAEIWQLVDVPNSETLAGVPSLSPGESRSFIASYDNFAREVVTPVATTDYLANTAEDGTGTDKTSDISLSFDSWSNGAKVTLTNDASVLVYITFLRIRGKLYTDEEAVVAVAEDSTSQDTYQKRTLDLTGDFMSDINTAEELCKYALSLRKDPQPELEMTFWGSTDTLMTQILAREISGRITISNAELGITRNTGYWGQAA